MPAYHHRAAGLLALLPLLTAPLALTGAGPPSGEVTLDIEGFTLHVTNEAGALSHRLRGRRLREFGREGPQWVDDPRLELFADGHLQWQWSAPNALHKPSAAVLELIGPVRGVQAADAERPETVVRSRDVRLATETMVATSTEHSTFRQPGLLQRGTGLRVDTQSDTMELLDDVYSLYSPPREEESRHVPPPP